MCPVCLTTAMLIAGSATSSGGLAAIAIRRFGRKNAADNHAVSMPTQVSRMENGTRAIVPNAKERSICQRA
jgi:hypothetical protein